MVKVIINADDCGYNEIVNDHIENLIKEGKITSTTIMANMDDFDGAVKLYKKYGKTVSFGIHLNLTEGKPLLYSQELIDAGIVVADGNEYKFCGSFPYKCVSSKVLKAIHRELTAQIDKIISAGIIPTHFDSHHFIHTYPSLLSLTPMLMEETGVTKVRRLRNYVPNIFLKAFRSFWFSIIRFQNNNVSSTDYFTSFKAFYENNYKCDKSIELMCHPGGPLFVEEERILEGAVFPSHIKLISYHDID